ncbi:hypothetical protein [Paraburkholderia sp. BR13444]
MHMLVLAGDIATGAAVVDLYDLSGPGASAGLRWDNRRSIPRL